MTIQTIITKYYYTLKQKCHNDYTVISQSRTSEDILNDVCMTAIRKFKNKDIDESEGLEYLERTLFYELKYQPNRRDTHMIFTDDLTDFEK